MQQDVDEKTLMSKIERLKQVLNEKDRTMHERTALDNKIEDLRKEAESLRKGIGKEILVIDRDLAYVVGRTHPDIDAKYLPVNKVL